MKTLSAIVLTLGLAAASASAQTIKQVSNAASEALAATTNASALPNSSIAQGSYFSIYGDGFGPAFSSCGANNGCLWTPYPLPTSIVGTSAAVTVGGTTVAAYIEFAANFGSYSQINAVLPSNTPTGTGTVTVTTNGTTTPAFPITVVSSSFGTFTLNQAGTGPGIITNVNYQILTPFLTAKPGDYVILWGTGLGPVADPTTEISAGPPQTDLCHPASSACPTVWVAGQKASIYYAGRSSYTAEDQVVFQIPAGVQGCYVQVAIQTGSIVSNVSSMSVDPTGPTCSDSDGINYGDIASVVASKGHANVGSISLLSNYLNLTILGTPLQWDNDTVSGEIASITESQMDAFQGFALAPSVNNCSVSPFVKYPPPTDPILSQLTYLDAGPNMSIQGPNGTVNIAQNCDPASASGCGANGKGYSGLVGGSTIAQLLSGNSPAPYFLSSSYAIDSGTYTVTSPGGSAVGAISASIPVSSAAASFKWTNPPTGSISRTSPLTINWTGGDPSGFVDITAISSTILSGTPATGTPGILVECIAPTSAGTFTIPTYILASLPSTAASTALDPPGELLVGPASPAVKVTPPSGLDELYIFYHLISGSAVTWQ